jgi:hypothetical protein
VRLTHFQLELRRCAARRTLLCYVHKLVRDEPVALTPAGLISAGGEVDVLAIVNARADTALAAAADSGPV